MAKKAIRQRTARGEAARNDGGGFQTAENLEQVREILFGGNMRLFESRVTEVEKRLLQSTAELRDAVDARFETLEGRLGADTAALGERLNAARKDGTKEIRGVEKELRNLGRSLEKQLLGLQEQIDEVMRTLEERADQLRASKVDTSSLAVLLSEMAERLDASDGSDA